MSSNYGLQIFSKRFRFQLHYQNPQHLFTDRTGKSLKIEPLATVGQLRTFLASMVSKQWYDHLHGHLEFVKRLKSDGRQHFTYVSDFDQNGILYWVGTNARTVSDYSNPCSTGLVSVTCPDSNCPVQHLCEMISHLPRTEDDENNNDTNRGFNWIMIDLGLFIIPTHFTLRHGTGGFPHWTKTFLFQISKDGAHFLPCEISVINETNSLTATWTIKTNLNENSSGFRFLRFHQKSGRHPICIAGLEIYGQVISAVDIRSNKPDLYRSRSSRDDARNHSTTSRQAPSYHHSHSTSSASARANKMQSHILRRLASMRSTGTTTILSTGNSNGSNNSASNSGSSPSTIDRILFDQMLDLSSIPIDLSTALESDDPERLRLVIQETLSRLTGDTTLNDNTNLLNLISQRKSVSTPNISNGDPVFSVSSTEQASSAESLISSSRATDHTIDLMEGFRDQIARQYDALVAQTQLEPTIEEPTTSLWLSSSNEDFLAPIRTDPSHGVNWLELGDYTEETILASKDETKDKRDNLSPNPSNEHTNCGSRLFPSAQTTPITTTTHSRQSISSTTESVESMCAVTEENNKKNATSECSEQRIILLENDMNASVPNLSTTNPTAVQLSSLLTTAQSSPNLTTPTTITIANVAIIDDESMPIEESRSLSEIPLSDQQQKQTDETSEDEDMDDDEHCQLKRVKSDNEQIQPSIDQNEEDDDDDEDEEPDEEEPEQDENFTMFAEQEEEEYDEQLQQQIHGEQQSVTRRNWDDDFVLKRQFSVLLPAFDGRPGRTNINATQDIPVPTSMTPKEATLAKRISTTDASAAANMTLYIRGPSPQIPGLREDEIEMDDPDATIFKYIQQLIKPFPSSQRSERIKRVFEPTYTIVYSDKSTGQSKSEEISFQSLPSCPTDVEMLSPTIENLQSSSSSTDPKDVCAIEDILQLLRQLYYLLTSHIQSNPHQYESDENLSFENYFYSKKLNNKLLQQIQDSIIIASASLPSWTEWLTHSYKFLYPFETRQLYFRTTSFGTSRSIVWLQERRDELIRTARTGGLLRPLGGSTTATAATLSSFRVASNPNENSSSTSNMFVPEFRLGRLKIDRATPVDRENILRDAMNLFHYHAKSKAKLEIQFLNEEGTGDGPTLEFYALIANELQQHSLGLWWNHDDYEHHQTIYVRKLEGLFPIPYPQTDERLEMICNYFSLIGIYFAKCLLDKYLIDMPLSIAVLKLLCMKPQSSHPADLWYENILDSNDLIDIEPSRGKFFQQLYQLIEQRNRILNDTNKTNEQKRILCSKLKIENAQHEPVDLEHLCLTFVFLPPSNTYGYQSIELIPNGSHIDVTIDNVDQYVKLSLEFIFRDGIRRQMDAFRNGFNQVFAIEHLRCFNPHELKLLLCGNQWPSWTLDDLLNYIEPSHGFTRESPGFTKFLNVMLELDGLERKSVVQFITGCSSLPPGGLANLRPRLAVARKVEADDNSYPSVNTCYHYLKLPDYSSEEILKLRLMTACKERGFYFN